MNNQGLKLLYDQHSNKVYNLALGYLQSAEDAEEITLDVFFEVYKSSHAFLGEAAISTWIYRITINKCLDRIRFNKRKKRNSALTVQLNEEALIEEKVHPGVILENKETSKILFKAISKLPINQQHAFLLQQIEQCTNPQIATILETSIGAVESLLHRAKQNLRKEIQKYLEV